jgi:hypothetical protein
VHATANVAPITEGETLISGQARARRGPIRLGVSLAKPNHDMDRVSCKVGQCIRIMPSDVLRPKGVTEHLAELVVDWCLPRDNVDRPACGFGLE